MAPRRDSLLYRFCTRVPSLVREFDVDADPDG
jgi:hypothetical protein